VKTLSDGPRLFARVSVLGVLLACGSAGSAMAQPRVVAYTGQPVDGVRVLNTVDSVVVNEEGRVLFRGLSVIDTPAFDECAGAVEVFRGVTSVSTADATTTASPACGRYDVWLRFTAPLSENLIIRMSETSDLAWGLYAGQCGALVARISCPRVGEASFAAVAGETYFLRIGASSMFRGVRTISISHSPSPVLEDSVLHDESLFLTGNGPLEEVLRNGDAVSWDPSLWYRSLSFAALGSDDHIAVPAATRRTATETTRVSLVDIEGGGEGEEVLRDTDTAWTVPLPHISLDGRLVYALNNGRSLVIGDQVIQNATPAPEIGPEVNLLLIEQPVVEGVFTAFRASLTGTGVVATNDHAVWINRDAQTGSRLVARLGDVAPGAAPDVFATLPLRPAVSERGDVAFTAALSGQDVVPENRTGLWTGVPGSLQLLFRAGEAVPTIDGALFASFSDAAGVTARGDVVFRAGLAGKTVSATDNTAICLASPGLAGTLLRIIAREGDPAPGAGKDRTFASFDSVLVSPVGDVAFMARLGGGAVQFEHRDAIYLAARGGAPRLIARAGDSVELPSGEVKIIRDLSFGGDSSVNGNGGRSALTFHGQIVYVATFTDSSQAILTTEPFCAADWDHSGLIDSGDFFAFVTDFFDSAADFNRSGFNDSQDFFDFINAFFTACPG